MQETSCTYEIVVGDNVSTDGTRDILREYWRDHPDKFSIILNDVNVGLTSNIYNAMMKSKGKYIAILYGDDYWISKDKLQKQYEFLEKTPKCIGVTSAMPQEYETHTDILNTIYRAVAIAKKANNLEMCEAACKSICDKITDPDPLCISAIINSRFYILLFVVFRRILILYHMFRR